MLMLYVCVRVRAACIIKVSVLSVMVQVTIFPSHVMIPNIKFLLILTKPYSVFKSLCMLIYVHMYAHTMGHWHNLLVYTPYHAVAMLL